MTPALNLARHLKAARQTLALRLPRLASPAWLAGALLVALTLLATGAAFAAETVNA